MKIIDSFFVVSFLLFFLFHFSMLIAPSPWITPTVVVTINTSVTPRPFVVTPPLVPRSVSSPPAALVVSVVEPVTPRMIKYYANLFN
jgi:hypothetical protein